MATPQWIPACCAYNVRSYDADGRTRWTLDTHRDGIYRPEWMASDEDGNLYLASQNATAELPYALASYDADRRLRWKRTVAEVAADYSLLAAAIAGGPLVGSEFAAFGLGLIGGEVWSHWKFTAGGTQLAVPYKLNANDGGFVAGENAPSRGATPPGSGLQWDNWGVNNGSVAYNMSHLKWVDNAGKPGWWVDSGVVAANGFMSYKLALATVADAPAEWLAIVMDGLDETAVNWPAYVLGELAYSGWQTDWHWRNGWHATVGRVVTTGVLQPRTVLGRYTTTSDSPFAVTLDWHVDQLPYSLTPAITYPQKITRLQLDSAGNVIVAGGDVGSDPSATTLPTLARLGTADGIADWSITIDGPRRPYSLQIGPDDAVAVLMDSAALAGASIAVVEADGSVRWKHRHNRQVIGGSVMSPQTICWDADGGLYTLHGHSPRNGESDYL